MKRIVGIVLILLALAVVVSGLRPAAAESDFDIDGYGKLPVQVGGRIKPLDTVARNMLLILSKRQTVETPEGRELEPVEWLVELNMRPERADTLRTFKIEFPDDLGLAGLAEQGQRYYSFNDLRPHFAELDRRYAELPAEAQQRDPIQRQIARLHEGLTLYHRLMHSFHPLGPPERMGALVDEYRTYQSLAPRGLAELRKQQAGEPYDEGTLNAFMAFGDQYLKLSQTAHLNIIPPGPEAAARDEGAGAEWNNIGVELLDVMRGDAISPYATAYAALTMAYRAGEPETFNSTLGSLRERFATSFPDDAKRLRAEAAFNATKPFYISMELYLLVLLIVLVSWIRWNKVLANPAFAILVLAFVVHTAGLAARMWIQGRPPVTNLYSSAIFVGWGAALLGIVLEYFYRVGIGAAMASIVGFCTLIIAHHLSMGGDTLEMMRAVLDSNFWLATHVVVITLGYSAMFVAGALALIFVLRGLVDRSFDAGTARALSGMVYGITCFAVLFSLVGTILGGIWADQSWGRFWGWDPKENGALMIVLMGAITLHARWGGLARERGIMALALCGNIVTAWSWFGTNLLGVGLHSYGFTDSGFRWMVLFVFSQLALIGLANLPWKLWRSDFGRGKHLKDRKRMLMAGDAADSDRDPEFVGG